MKKVSKDFKVKRLNNTKLKLKQVDSTNNVSVVRIAK